MEMMSLHSLKSRLLLSKICFVLKLKNENPVFFCFFFNTRWVFARFLYFKAVVSRSAIKFSVTFIPILFNGLPNFW